MIRCQTDVGGIERRLLSDRRDTGVSSVTDFTRFVIQHRLQTLQRPFVFQARQGTANTHPNSRNVFAAKLQQRPESSRVTKLGEILSPGQTCVGHSRTHQRKQRGQVLVRELPSRFFGSGKFGWLRLLFVFRFVARRVRRFPFLALRNHFRFFDRALFKLEKLTMERIILVSTQRIAQLFV